MEPTRKEISLEESMAEVMQALPTVIREYLVQEKYTPATQILIHKYRLRTDHGGILEREIMLLLMGIESPDDFSQALSDEAKLDQQTINAIMQDVNEQIFIPLREQMRNAGTVMAQPARGAPPPPRAAVVNAQVPNYAPSQRPVAPAPMPTPPVRTSVPAPSQSRSVQQSSTASLPPRFGAARPALTALPRPEAISVRLEDHEMARLEFQAAPATTPVARTAPPPENLPGATPPTPPPAPAAPVPPRVEPPVIPPPPAIQRPTAPAPTPVAPARPPYSADPYREILE